MISSLQQTARRGIRVTVEIVERLYGIELLLFYAAMLLKLILFDRLIDVKNMAMTPDDVLVALGSLALVSFWTILLPFRGRIAALAILNLVLTLVIYADLVYYRYFQDLISVPVLFQASQLDSLGGSIGALLRPVDLWLYADWPFVIPFMLYALFGNRDARRSRTHNAARPVWRKLTLRLSVSLIVFACGMALVFVPVNIAKNTWAKGLFSGNWWNVSLYNVTGVIGFHGYDAYRYAERRLFHHNKLPAEQTAEAGDWFKARGEARARAESDGLFGAYKGSNVIVIQVEALQNFVIGRSVNGQEVTPNMNRLLEDSVYFSRFYHQTAQGRTSDADFAVQCSAHPVLNGSVFIQYAHNEFECLPKVLKDNGYTASAFHAYEGGFWNRNVMYDRLGYDHFYNKKHFAMDEPLGWSLGDDSFFQQSISLLAKQKQPFYAFLITLTSHHPYSLPKDRRKLDVGEYDGTIFGDYLQSVHYVDQAVGHLVERLKKEGLWDKTILLLYGDHDNSINEWSYFESFVGKPLNEIERQQMLKQVPLIVHLPDGAHAGTYDDVGGQIDLSPTIQHLLGISTKDQHLVGTPLITAKPVAEDKQVVLRSGAFTDGKVYYLPSSDGIPENGACWDLASGETTDPAICKPGAQAAARELAASDRLVEYNLVPVLSRGE
ncbi:LTA synthase family protein [Paenibacillus cisolokensis]|uniref:Sulfatase n=1 Tax=Paenibacillus cisolokensis TaxID=1658519 RepID=A0ABQ4N820_9BACL|nr:LTA synthase family protein [Paenibacillus cisolokensis]GIQ64403.1 sulfatase [Paenibacillus cisolokensis]